MDGHESLVSRIAALHVVYHFSRPQVLWFGQLVSNLPGIMSTLDDKVAHDDSEMVCLILSSSCAEEDSQSSSCAEEDGQG